MSMTKKLLRVNLNLEQFSIIEEEEATLAKYLGGVGLGSRILYDEVPPEIQWSDPENRDQGLGEPTLTGHQVGQPYTENTPGNAPEP